MKKLSLALVLCLIVGLFAGCGKQNEHHGILELPEKDPYRTRRFCRSEDIFAVFLQSLPCLCFCESLHSISLLSFDVLRDCMRRMGKTEREAPEPLPFYP